MWNDGLPNKLIIIQVVLWQIKHVKWNWGLFQLVNGHVSIQFQLSPRCCKLRSKIGSPFCSQVPKYCDADSNQSLELKKIRTTLVYTFEMKTANLNNESNTIYNNINSTELWGNIEINLSYSAKEIITATCRKWKFRILRR